MTRVCVWLAAGLSVGGVFQMQAQDRVAGARPVDSALVVQGRLFDANRQEPLTLLRQLYEKNRILVLSTNHDTDTHFRVLMPLLRQVGEDPRLKYVMSELEKSAAPWLEAFSVTDLDQRDFLTQASDTVLLTFCSGGETEASVTQLLPLLRELNRGRPAANKLRLTGVDGGQLPGSRPNNESRDSLTAEYVQAIWDSLAPSEKVIITYNPPHISKEQASTNWLYQFLRRNPGARAHMAIVHIDDGPSAYLFEAQEARYPGQTWGVRLTPFHRLPMVAEYAERTGYDAVIRWPAPAHYPGGAGWEAAWEAAMNNVQGIPVPVHGWEILCSPEKLRQLVKLASDLLLPRGKRGDLTGIPAPKNAPTTPEKTAQPTVPDTGWTIEKPLIGREVECTNGKAAIFECHSVDLMSFLPLSAIGATESMKGIVNTNATAYLNDLWGWTDAATGREFALVGRVDGTSFVEVTDPLHPKYLGNLPAPPSFWRDIKVIKNYAFIVSEAQRHGIQIFDLTQLRDVKNAPVAFKESAHYDSVGSARNIVADTATGFVYVVGARECGGGLHMVDANDPLHPKFAGCYAEAKTGRAGTGYIQDAQCTVYHGPDQKYQGHEICVNAAETAVSIADVTDKKHPKTTAIANYPNVRYANQGWLTEDQRYFFLGDEWDEYGGRMTRTMVFDLNDLHHPVLVKEFFGTTRANDHNLYVRGPRVYQSNYKAGLRILDIRDPTNPTEVAYFDTTPNAEGSGYAGSWSNYPYFKNGVIAVSSMEEGLFLLRLH